MIKNIFLLIWALLTVAIIIFISMLFLFNRFVYNENLTIHPVKTISVNRVMPRHKAIERVLVLDSGGTHGIGELYILDRLQKISGKPISQLFDIIVGTSTGSIVAVSLTSVDAKNVPFSPNQLINMYNENISKILSFSEIRGVLTLQGLLNGIYSINTMNTEFKSYMGNRLLSQSIVPVIVPVFCLKEHRLMFFKSWCDSHSCGEDSFPGNYYISDVATASSSAPTLFNPTYITGASYCNGAIDNASFAPDPTLYALPEIDKIVRAKKYIIVDLGSEMRLEGQPNEKYNGLYFVKYYAFNTLKTNKYLTKKFLNSRFVRNDQVDYFKFFVPYSRCLDEFDASKACIKYLNDASESYVQQQNSALVSLVHLLTSVSTKASDDSNVN